MSQLRLGILASHTGSTMQAVIDACADGRIDAQIVMVISNNSQSQALQRAATANIATRHLSSAIHKPAEALDAAIASTLNAAGADLVVLCGYMKKLGDQTIKAFHGRLINTHPALLPKHGGQGFYGRRVHEAVLAAGDTESGATVHHVAGVYDTGEIIAQARVPVLAQDRAEDLEERVKTAERQLLVATLSELASAHKRGTQD